MQRNIQEPITCACSLKKKYSHQVPVLDLYASMSLKDINTTAHLNVKCYVFLMALFGVDYDFDID